jgi:hypothetical protein
MEESSSLLKHAMFVFWLLKVYELLDTVFVVLRQNRRQMIFLTIFYHICGVLLADWAYFLSPIPAIVPLLAVNSILHVVTYGYFCLSSEKLKIIFFKTFVKRIMQVQMVQLLVFVFYGAVGAYGSDDSVFTFSLCYALSLLAAYVARYYQRYA